MDNNKKKITIELSNEVCNSLEAILNKIKGKQVPDTTTLSQFIELILSNYVSSSKAMEKMSGELLSDLQNKIGNIFGGTENITEDFYKNMMDNLKNMFDNNSTKKDNNPPEEEKKKSKVTDTDKKKS